MNRAQRRNAARQGAEHLRTAAHKTDAEIERQIRLYTKEANSSAVNQRLKGERIWTDPGFDPETVKMIKEKY